jgi:predicted GNAT family acetyltransferase
MEGKVRLVVGEKESAFVYEVEGKKLAEMVYMMSEPNKLVILHTEVDESLKGLSVGKKLQTALVEYVRANNIKVVPVCPFAKAMFRKIKDWQDVLV